MEWGDTISSALPAERLSVTICFGSGDNDRSFELHSHGESWQCRVDRLTAALEPWTTPC